MDKQMLGCAEIAILRPELAGVQRAEESNSGMSR